MCRFILLHHFNDEKGKLKLAMFDKKKKFFKIITVRQFRDNYAFYIQEGIEKGEKYSED